MFIKPAQSRVVRHPGTLRLLSPSGETVTPSPFWHRLLAVGDVVECAPPSLEPQPSQKVSSALTERRTEEGKAP